MRERERDREKKGESGREGDRICLGRDYYVEGRDWERGGILIGGGGCVQIFQQHSPCAIETLRFWQISATALKAEPQARHLAFFFSYFDHELLAGSLTSPPAEV